MTVDVLAAIVRVKAQHRKRQVIQYGSQCGQQKRLTDAGDRNDDLNLRDTVHDVDVINPLHALVIALVNTIDAQKTGTALRIGAFAHANGHRRAGGGGLGKVYPRLHVTHAFAQVVQVRDRDVGQGREFDLAVHPDGPFGELLGGGPGERTVGTVDLDQAAQRVRTVALGKRHYRCTTSIFEAMAIPILRNQAVDLRARIARHALNKTT